MDFVICYFKVVRLHSSLTALVLGGASVRILGRVLWCTLFMSQLKIALFMYCIRIFKFNKVAIRHQQRQMHKLDYSRQRLSRARENKVVHY